MKLILASGNRGKLKEFRELISNDLLSVNDIYDSFEVEENEDTFAGNALLKAKALYDKVGSEYIVISDDSGISVPALGGEPGIYSARYAGEDATDSDNLIKLIYRLKEKGIKSTPSYYTAAIAIVSNRGEYVVHGWMHGRVITEPKGDNGFGYDPIFIPDGYDKTIAQLDGQVKAKISHRVKALDLALPIIEMLRR